MRSGSFGAGGCSAALVLVCLQACSCETEHRTPSDDAGATGGRTGAGGSATAAGGRSPGSGGSAAGGVTAGSGGSSTASGGGVADGGPPLVSDAAPPDAGSAPADAGDAAAGLPTTIRVHYPAGSQGLSVRGAGAPLDWSTGTALTPGADDVWTLTVVAASPLEFKPALDDVTLSRGPSYQVLPGSSVDVYPHFLATTGSWSRAYELESTLLGNTRGIWIYKPPSHDENTRARFPVVYMQDGADLFDPSAAFGGRAWEVAETLDAAAESGAITQAIVVGVEATSQRIDEYTPTADAQLGGGRADLYVRMLVEELKPRIDAELRTLPEAVHTAIVGSSLGGLLSAHAGVTRADVFGLVGAMSPSTWWDESALLVTVGTVPGRPQRATRVYVDSGDTSDGTADTAALAEAYRAVGYVDGTTLKYVVQVGGTHDAASWSQRLPGGLAFLLGERTP